MSTQSSMSKRKGDNDVYEVFGESLRSTRSCLTLNSHILDHNSNQPLYHVENPFLIKSIQDLLNLIFTVKCKTIDELMLREQSVSLSQQLRTPMGEVKRLKYTNQIIEIPIYPKPIVIKYNSNFPFIREPMSLSVQCDKFLANPYNYQLFNKIILKNATIVPLMHTLQIILNPNTQLSFTLDCYIVSENKSSIESQLNENVFDAANIIFELPELWRFGYCYINSDTELRDADKVLLISEYWRNFKLMFSEMSNLDLLVSVKQDKVHIHNILHHHYTS